MIGGFDLSSSYQHALSLIYIYNDTNTESLWAKIPKNTFLKSLTENLKTPARINQGRSNLCGPASICKIMAEKDPESYTRMAISLYERGVAKSNNSFHFPIESNESLHNESPTDGLSPADYVVLSSLRQSYNIVFDYTPESDTGLQGFSYPNDLIDIAVNFANLTDYTLNYGHDISGINKALNHGAAVIGLFDIDQLKTGKPNNQILQRRFGNHYIIINSIKRSYDQVEINYWNWGDTSENQTTVLTDIKNYDSAIRKYLIIGCR
ncbi:hypothetical protein [Marinigracilibium pacificum]|uniref:Peptidase C39-like domain-containing protein n=1 Tax=Marinigracilibium pacificum TaxID=2729599 RepID=A0A848J1W8_9BACT|nr:hypothetical protein [Marinigracilibium pacificum]NMM48464.1 hypothetical protein [Marinigracilibium pacificum]